MKLRYKTSPDNVFEAGTFNITALAEVLTGDDSAYVRDLDCLIEHSWTGLCPECGHFWKDHMDGRLLLLFKEKEAKVQNYWCRYDLAIDGRQKCMCKVKFVPQWKDLNQAMKDRDVITDNYNKYFFEPRTSEDRIRGFTL